MRILGIDYGDKKIGLALGESDSGVAVPIGTMLNTDRTFDELKEQVRAEQIDLVVVGVPLRTGGHHDEKQLEKTRAFVSELAASVDIPVEEEDESYTTAESIRLQREEGAEADEDALAAMLITRAYLERDG